MVSIESGIYDTGCDITVVTRTVISRLQEKTARWIEHNWTRFDLNGSTEWADGTTMAAEEAEPQKGLIRSGINDAAKTQTAQHGSTAHSRHKHVQCTWRRPP